MTHVRFADGPAYNGGSAYGQGQPTTAIEELFEMKLKEHLITKQPLELAVGIGVVLLVIALLSGLLETVILLVLAVCAGLAGAALFPQVREFLSKAGLGAAVEPRPEPKVTADIQIRVEPAKDGSYILMATYTHKVTLQDGSAEVTLDERNITRVGKVTASDVHKLAHAMERLAALPAPLNEAGPGRGAEVLPLPEEVRK